MGGFNHAQMQATRILIANSHHVRQRAVAEFPLRVASASLDLKKMCDLRDTKQFPYSAELDSAINYLEKQIRDCYREIFGSEMIENETGENNVTNETNQS